MAKKLSAKQEAFIREYVLCRVGSEALRRAGYKSKNENVDASQLLATPSIKAKIDALIKKTEEKAKEKFEITQDRILQELATVAFGNLGSLISPSGDFAMPENPENDLKFLASYSMSQSIHKSNSEDGVNESKNNSFSISGQNKVKALELLGKHIGLWSKNGNADSDGTNARDPKIVLNRLRDVLAKSKK